MKKVCFLITACLALTFSCNNKSSQDMAANTGAGQDKKQLFLDVHNLEPGKVTMAAVAEAHQKDLATQGKYNVSFIKYWVDEAQGKVYCLAEAPDSVSLYKTHQEAHGLVPDLVHPVTDGPEAMMSANPSLYLDVHILGPGKVKAEDVAKAHEKDLAVQDKYGVKFINYWVDEKAGTVMCLSEATDSTMIIKTHQEAHGLLPAEIHKVGQGQ
jgi:hypothetical protein